MPVISSVGPHFGEESVLVGRDGSGTIFFAGCNLGCIFCQNFDISHLRRGEPITIAELAEFMLDLQKLGCSNINFVTPTHVAPALAAGIELARKNGLNLPTVYNSGGYDSVETLRLLDGLIDIYMPDMKFSDSAAAKEYANAADYPEISFAALKEMHRQVGDLKTDEHGVATRGVLVRHLVMPNDLAGTRAAMRFLARDISTHTYVNVMSQYRPCGSAHQYVSINRSLTREEYARALETAQEEGITRLDERTGIRLRFL